MNISCALKLLNANRSQHTPTQVEKLVGKLSRSVSIDDEIPRALTGLFFKNKVIHTERLENGVVETPDYIASTIVKIAIEAYFKKQNEEIAISSLNSISWFDPCVGGGAFPVAILKFYFNTLGSPNEASQLPKLTITDIAPEGVFLALCAIRSVLKSSSVTLDDYLDSGRLQYSVEDTLSHYGESLSLIQKTTKYDIIVGNPPYVRSTRLTQAYRRFLKAQFPTSYYGSADLYMYFIASGLCSLAKSGLLAFISPASFLRTRSGRSIRSFIQNKGSLEALIDLDETRVFDDAAVHTAIYILRNRKPQNTSIRYIHISSLEEIGKLSGGYEGLDSAHVEFPQNHGWAFHKSSNSYSRFNDIYKNCKPLNQFGINIYSGIRSGLTKAFIVDEQYAKSFPSKLRKDWIRPIVLPADIIGWKGNKRLHYLIFTPRGAERPPESILQHLRQYKERLATRTEVKEPKEWFMLRPCTYYDQMFKPKIIFPDLSAKQRFSLCEGTSFVSDGAYFLDSDDLVLLGILNSSIAKEYFIQRCSSVGNLSTTGRFRFKKTFLKDFPLPIGFIENHETRSRIESVVRVFLRHGEEENDIAQLNTLVKELYGI